MKNQVGPCMLIFGGKKDENASVGNFLLNYV